MYGIIEKSKDSERDDQNSANEKSPDGDTSSARIEFNQRVQQLKMQLKNFINQKIKTIPKNMTNEPNRNPTPPTAHPIMSEGKIENENEIFLTEMGEICENDPYKDKNHILELFENQIDLDKSKLEEEYKKNVERDPFLNETEQFISDMAKIAMLAGDPRMAEERIQHISKWKEKLSASPMMLTNDYCGMDLHNMKDTREIHSVSESQNSERNRLLNSSLNISQPMMNINEQQLSQVTPINKAEIDEPIDGDISLDKGEEDSKETANDYKQISFHSKPKYSYTPVKGNPNKRRSNGDELRKLIKTVYSSKKQKATKTQNTEQLNDSDGSIPNSANDANRDFPPFVKHLNYLHSKSASFSGFENKEEEEEDISNNVNRSFQRMQPAFTKTILKHPRNTSERLLWRHHENVASDNFYIPKKQGKKKVRFLRDEDTESIDSDSSLYSEIMSQDEAKIRATVSKIPAFGYSSRVNFNRLYPPSFEQSLKRCPTPTPTRGESTKRDAPTKRHVLTKRDVETLKTPSLRSPVSIRNIKSPANSRDPKQGGIPMSGGKAKEGAKEKGKEKTQAVDDDEDLQFASVKEAIDRIAVLRSYLQS